MITFDKLIKKLDEEGYNSYRIKQTNLMGQRTYYALKNHTGYLDYKTLNKICSMFKCQPSELMEWIPDEEDINT